ncbi:SPFH domain-containing protein [Haliangium ochraceum]|uniref:Band 7 protein n=1 Tax=Haliangium ochraceum (strain DSM 14365 / JCM 11303 / SMP-2) TaxID=502025 RepID=D0LM46_HALO1|nr:SPFH domain-containing protein [Haliangium ochraceum]ACY16752.1 band 7 protein [Haliangium ochraceum DSM 14365]
MSELSGNDALKDAKAAAEGLVGKLRNQRSYIWVAGAALLLAILSMRSCTTLEAGQVAVRVNNLTGGQETLTRPGLLIRLPFGLHSVYVLDASPQTFIMKGEQNLDALHVRELTVRASDGSNFVFKDTTVIFRVLGDQAQNVIRDSGPGSAFLAWMKPYARAILRDEFGRESTISVSNPAKFGEATTRARDRLNERLAKHGIEITQIVTPRPRFSQAYEGLIESRNEAENQLAVIDSELRRAETDRQRQLAEVDRDQNRIIQEKRAELETALAQAVTQKAQTEQAVDTLRIEKIGQGQAALSAAESEARELRGRLDAEYQARRAEIDAFRNQPVERVMERLGERLQGVTIDIQPWADDATPSRLQVEQYGGAQ